MLLDPPWLGAPGLCKVADQGVAHPVADNLYVVLTLRNRRNVREPLDMASARLLLLSNTSSLSRYLNGHIHVTLPLIPRPILATIYTPRIKTEADR